LYLRRQITPAADLVELTKNPLRGRAGADSELRDSRTPARTAFTRRDPRTPFSSRVQDPVLVDQATADGIGPPPAGA
jgi:hypothetical protein